MTLKEFKHYADLYGGDIDRWPTPENVDALTLLEASPEARAILAEAMALDALLDRAAPAVSEESVQRVLDGIARRVDEPMPRRLGPWFLSAPPVRFWPTAGFLAAMGMVGFVVAAQGIWPTPTSSARNYPEVIVMSSYLGAME